jgi:hypothetical protein
MNLPTFLHYFEKFEERQLKLIVLPIIVYWGSFGTKKKRTYLMLQTGMAGCLHLKICSPESRSLNSRKKILKKTSFKVLR